MTIKELQERAYKNKLNHNFNVTDIPLEFCYLNRELGEAFEAYMNKSAKFGEELADVAIYLLGLCEITGVDLEKEIIHKMGINETRTYIENNKYKFVLGKVKLENKFNILRLHHTEGRSNEQIFVDSMLKACKDNNMSYELINEISEKSDEDKQVSIFSLNRMFWESDINKSCNYIKSFNSINVLIGYDDRAIKFYNCFKRFDTSLDIGLYDIGKEFIRLK